MNEGLATLHDDLQDLLGQTVAGRYRIGVLIGVGGMAAVFKAKHLGLGRDMAFKVLHPHLTNHPEISARFDREAKSASRLDHPNCVQVTDYGSTEQGMKFMVMQLLEGGELTQLLEESLDPLRAVDLTLQILRGLDHAHRQGVIHRDIKPENVFVTRDHDNREVLKLVDFGIAKIVNSGVEDKHKTTAGMVFGTPAYMSPEQAMGVEADARADLYSAGVLLYTMLAGKLPLDNEDPVALVRMQVSADPEPLPASVPPVVAATVGRLLQKDRDKRFQTAGEAVQVLEALRPMLGGGEVSNAIPAANSSTPIYVDSDRQIVVDPTGQILVDASGQLAVADPADAEEDDTSGPFDLLRSRTTEARANLARRPRWQSFALGGAAAALVLMGAIWVVNQGALGGSEDDAETAGVGAATVDSGANKKGANADGLDISELEEIDQFLLAEKADEADTLLSPLRDAYPENAQLFWRQGKVLGLRKGKKAQSLAAYGNALQRDPALMDDKLFYAELHDLMRNRKVRDEALDLALQHMGTHGHQFLLEEVNDEKRPLSYNDRRRALAELQTLPKSEGLINNQLNLALDVLQAKESLTPCKSYRDALESIAATSDPYFHSRVEHAEVPEPPTADAKANQDDPSACEGLTDRRTEVLELLATLAAEAEAEQEEAEVVIDDDPPVAAEPEKAAPKKKRAKGDGKSKKSKCKGLGALKKDCWKKK